MDFELSRTAIALIVGIASGGTARRLFTFGSGVPAGCRGE
jgi:hypothetical protein